MTEKWTRAMLNWKGKKYLPVLAVILAGILLLALPTGQGTAPAEEDAFEPVTQTALFDPDVFSAKLEETLSQMEGVGNVSVLLTLKNSGEQVLASDYDRDGDRIEEKIVLASGGSGTESAVTIKEFSPQFQGALIVCDGGGDSGVRLRVTEAVSALTGLGADKIAISKRK